MTRPIAAVMRVCLRGYKLTLSPALSALGVRCRHEPSCSSYSMDAIGRHGAWAGGWMTLARLSRCHPWGTTGYDPAPERPAAAARWWAPWRYGVWSWRARGPVVQGQDDNANAHLS